MRGVVWQNGENVTHFVSQRPIQHMQKKPVSDLHLFKSVSIFFSGGRSDRSGRHASFFAYGKGRSQQMPLRLFSSVFAVRAVVDRQASIQLWDFQLSHNAAFVNSEDLVIFFLRCSQAS